MSAPILENAILDPAQRQVIGGAGIHHCKVVAPLKHCVHLLLCEMRVLVSTTAKWWPH